MKRREPKRLALHRETLQVLSEDRLPQIFGGISMASVCQENTRPECGTDTIWSVVQ
ncbi:MAG TPA: hypothetical protein VHU81_03430 [Thermoanaerobaculia bacterium]|nr:hypothetical protein [Thermoanaerobaculia bacterium]